MNWQTVTTQSYFRTHGDDANFCDHSVPLLVNCSGVLAYDAPLRSDMPEGRHDHYLMVLLHGQMDAWVDGSPRSLRAGDAIFYIPERSYRYQRVGEERMVYLWVHFTGSDADNLLARRGLKLGEVYSIGRAEEIAEDVEAIHRLFITRPPFYLEEAAARLDVLLTHIARAAAQPDAAPPHDRIQASLEYLNRHYAEPLRLETLAGMEYLSASRYSALFRRATGRSPQQYLIELRLRNARELLLQTDLSVAEVARSVGYEDALYFSRLFRRHFDAPPRSVRDARGQEA